MNLVDILTPEFALGFSVFAVVVSIASGIYATIAYRKIINSLNKLK